MFVRCMRGVCKNLCLVWFGFCVCVCVCECVCVYVCMFVCGCLCVPDGGAWCATTGGRCESTPVGSAAGRRGGYGGGQQRQHRPPETLSTQQLREWAVRWGSAPVAELGVLVLGVESHL
ncbi:unnamed protein product, partial [Closterium sp. NIES-54]